MNKIDLATQMYTWEMWLTVCVYIYNIMYDVSHITYLMCRISQVYQVFIVIFSEIIAYWIPGLHSSWDVGVSSKIYLPDG